MRPATVRLAAAINAGVHRRKTQPGSGRHPLSADEARWYRIQASHSPAFGTPDACRVATLAVFDIDLLEHREAAR